MSIRREELNSTCGRTGKDTDRAALGQVEAPTSLAPVGSKGQKPRKGKHPQHLPKVGTSSETEFLMHEEHEAIFDTMGMGGSSHGARILMAVVGILLLAGAILALVALD